MTTTEQQDFYRNQALADGAKLLPEYIREITEIFCGCGQPETAWQWIKDYLTLCHERKWEKGCWAPETGQDYLAVYLMDHLRLTEHGTSVRYCWLEKKGEQVLAFLNEHGVDWEDGKWVDEAGTSWGDDH
jgi:hypothetical protein